MEEIWKDIEGYEGLYSVSNLGRVKSHEKTRPRGSGRVVFPEKILASAKSKSGYYLATLCLCGAKRSHNIHRLVAQAFLPNPKNLPLVNHKDGNKANNVASNLEWATYKENTAHAFASGLMETACAFRRKAVVGTDIKTGKVVRLDSIAKGLSLGFTPNSIGDVCRGRRHTHLGYTWKFAE